MVVVTGTTKGMGLSISRALGDAGAKLVISGRDQNAADSVATKLHETDGIDVRAIACDISDPASVDQFAARTLHAFGRVDALILNAAGASPRAVTRKISA
ncbi:SDR family NAD(P)-dependent oxidoreductase [Paraburkholderia solitsugae]|uniref:SDR family NAD(P)-dependent oxidoreductase n=1 Tax=Paraburkholderia solitsugae TaxID=2675748 RepID=UPI002E2ADACD|nr:SDR family NAD(P)-dependent oxidoreductase [Paraburkholderia solitsugae]